MANLPEDHDEELERLRGYRNGRYLPIHLDDVLGGHFRVVHKLGHGGFSTVWLCQDVRKKTPTYVAVKVLVAKSSGFECDELAMIEHMKRLRIHKAPGGEYVCLPLAHFTHAGGHGTHTCIVYPVMGVRLGAAMDILRRERNEDEAAKTIRRLLRQVAAGLTALHRYGICHGDLRPANILLRLKPLDGLEIDELYDVLGEPELVHIHSSHALGERVEGGLPRYRVYPADTGSLGVEYLCEEIGIIDFGQSFDTAAKNARPIGIARPYCPPEMVFDKAAGIEGDLWSLACVIFEARLGAKLIYPADVMGPDDEEYVIAVTELLGKLPQRWRNIRKDGYDIEDAEEHTPGRLFKQRGLSLDGDSQQSSELLSSIKSRILACQYRRNFRGMLKKILDIGDEEVDLLADLLSRLLNYDPELRMTAQEALTHPWFCIDS